MLNSSLDEWSLLPTIFIWLTLDLLHEGQMVFSGPIRQEAHQRHELHIINEFLCQFLLFPL